MDVSSLAGRVVTRIRPITGWHWLLPSSLPIPPTVPPTGGISLPQRGEAMGLPRSTYLTTNTLGPLSLPAGMLPVSDVPKASEPPAYLLVQASQLLGLVYFHDSCKCSLTLTLVSYPNPSPGWSFQERFHLTASTPFAQANFGALSGRFHTRQGCTLGACFHRIAATGRWVQAKAQCLR